MHPLASRILAAALTLPPLTLAAFADNTGSAIEPLRADHIADVFRPWRVDHVTLAPDGKHIACALNGDRGVSLMIIDVDHPDSVVSLEVGQDQLGSHWWEKPRQAQRLTYLGWADPNLMILSSDLTGVFAVDATGEHTRKLADSVSLSYIPERPSRNEGGSRGGGKGGGKGGGGGDLPPASSEESPRPVPRTPRVVGFAPDHPRSVLVEVHGRGSPRFVGPGDGMELLRIDVDTGKIDSVYTNDVARSVFLYDRQNRPRLFYSQPPGSKAEKLCTFVPYADPSGGLFSGATQAKTLPKFEVSPATYLGSRSIPIGFDYDPTVLYFASNEGRDTYALYAVDVRTGKRTAFAVEEPDVDLADLTGNFGGSPLLFDEAAGRLVGVRVSDLTPRVRWLDPEFATLQATLEAKLPERTVEILSWDASHTRYLVLVSSESEPGRYCVYFKDTDRLVRFFRRAPWLDPDKVNASSAFSVDSPATGRITGYLTEPQKTRINPPPLLIVLHDGPWKRENSGFDRQAQILADMGIVVARIDYRGSSGFGTRFREGLRMAIDRAPIEDIEAAVRWISTNRPIDTKRIALLGEGFGGFIALKALELHPGEFRCAVAIDAPTDIDAWLNPPPPQRRSNLSDLERMSKGGKGGGKGGKGGGFGNDLMTRPTPEPPVNFDLEVRRSFFESTHVKLNDLSPDRHADKFMDPVMIVQNRLGRIVPYDQGYRMREALRDRNKEVEFLETSGTLGSEDSLAMQDGFDRIEGFLNLHLYNYGVQVGEAKEKP